MKNNSLVKTGMFLIIAIISIAFLIVAKDILIPLAISMFFAYLLYPLVWIIERRGVHRGIAVFLVITMVIIVIGGALLPFAVKISNMTVDFSDIKEQFGAKTDLFQNMLHNKLGINAQTLDTNFKKFSENIVTSWQSEIGNIFAATTTTLFQIGILPVFIFFQLYYRTKTAYFIFRLVGRETKPLALKILRDIKTVATKYLGGMIIVVSILAVLNSLGLFIVGVKHALVLGVIAALLNLVPYLGTFLGGLIPFLYVFFTYPNPTETMVKVVVLFVVVQFIENNLLTPNIVGSSIKINPLAIILSLLFANMVWGIAGMFIIVPLLAIIKVIIRNIDGLKPYAYLISERGMDNQQIKFKAFTKIKNRIKNRIK